MEYDNNKCVNCTIKSKVVSILNNDELNVLEEGCSKTEFQKGELIFKEGSPASHITYIRNGFIKLSKKGIGGKDFILSISKKGSYLGIQNLGRERGDNYFSAISITDSQVCFIDIESFAKLLIRNGQFASDVISYIFSDEMNYFERLINNVQQQLPGRLANTLFYFRDHVYNENPFNINLTKAELASLIGTSRESVSRLLKEFQELGIIKMDKNMITILNDAKLAEIKMKG
ncbi:MAG: helix-turn-helix domain-containing protein [Draconibacterium sp.]|nr:helix-turn-helix domain-containing protein [Draconibacterium sp.]